MPRLVVTLVYDQSLVGGPPSVVGTEVHALHDAGYRVTQIDAVTRPDAPKGQWRPPKRCTCWSDGEDRPFSSMRHPQLVRG